MKNKKLVAQALHTMTKKQLVRTIVRTALDDLEDWFGQQFNQRQLVEEVQKRIHAAHPNFAPKEPLLRDRIVTVIDKTVAAADLQMERIEQDYRNDPFIQRVDCEDL